MVDGGTSRRGYHRRRRVAAKVSETAAGSAGIRLSAPGSPLRLAQPRERIARLVGLWTHRAR
jgi:hypothetical protein